MPNPPSKMPEYNEHYNQFKPYQQIDTIATDLDGTLLNDRHQISRFNQAILQRAIEQEKTVILATGRRLRSVLPFAKKFQGKIYIISNNGQVISHYPDLLFWQTKYLPADAIEQIIDWLQPWQLAPVLHVNDYSAGIDMLTIPRGNNPTYSRYVHSKNKNTHSISLTQLSKYKNRILIICYLDDSIELLKEIEIAIAKKCQKFYLRTVVTVIPGVGPCLEFLPIDVSKWTAIQTILRANRLSASGLLAFGDEINDNEMLQNAQFGIAVANARPKLKQYAHKISQYTCNQSAIAREIVLLKNHIF